VYVEQEEDADLEHATMDEEHATTGEEHATRDKPADEQAHG